MFPVAQITTDPLQTQTLVLPDQSLLSLTLYFVPMQYGWFINNLTWNSFVLNGLRITNSPNMLYQFQNELTFGLACFSKDNREPTQQGDFASGASSLYILSAAEVAQYTGLIQNGG